VEPAEAIKNMICRQKDLVKERSNQVAKYKLQVLSVGRSLTNQQDKLALNWLCMEGYKLWENTSKWPQYKIATSSTNPDERLVATGTRRGDNDDDDNFNNSFADV
jgi:hypothetical protein